MAGQSSSSSLPLHGDTSTQEDKTQSSGTGVAIVEDSEEDHLENWSIFSARGVKPDPESLMSVRDQMEMEVGNSIKYRTCTWQRVWLTFLHAKSLCD